MSITRSRRERIEQTAAFLSRHLADRLHAAGVPFKIAVSASRRTGSVYIVVRAYEPTGRRLKHSGACIRVSDHNQRGTRRANFSRPARRYYGVWCWTRRDRVARKVERIVGGIVNRYDISQQNASRQPHTHWAGQPNVVARRPRPVVLGVKGGEA